MIQRSPSGLYLPDDAGKISTRTRYGWNDRGVLEWIHEPYDVQAHDSGTPTWQIANFQWFDDDAALGSATALAAENVLLKVGPGQDVEFDTACRLRFQFDETNLGNPGSGFINVSHRRNGVGGIALDGQTGLRDLYLIATTHYANRATTTQVLASTPSGTFRAGEAWEHTGTDIDAVSFTDNYAQDDYNEIVVTVGIDGLGGPVHGDTVDIGCQRTPDSNVWKTVLEIVDPPPSAFLPRRRLPTQIRM